MTMIGNILCHFLSYQTLDNVHLDVCNQLIRLLVHCIRLLPIP